MGVSLKRSLELLPLLPVPQGEWTKDLGWLRKEIEEERKEALRKGKKELVHEASDKEVLMVLSEASLRAPIHSEYVEIFMYLMTKVMGDKVPEDLRRKELSEYETRLLEEMKRDIRDRQWRALEKALRSRRSGRCTTGKLFSPGISGGYSGTGTGGCFPMKEE